MKAAFVHDHYFVHDKKNNIYYDGSGGVFNFKLWQRYLAVFKSLIVVGREKKSLPNKLVDSTYKNVTFELRTELTSGIDRFLMQRTVKNELKKTLSKVDFAIIRVPSVLGYIAQDVCIENKIPYTLEVVACSWDAYWNYGSFQAKLMAPLEYFKLKMCVKKSPAVIYVTKKFLENRYPSNCSYEAISNVNIEEIIPITQKDTFYSSFGTLDIFKIALIGSFHVKYKGHYELLKSVKYLKENKNITRLKVYLVGTGDPSWVINLANNLGVSDQVEIVGTLKSGKDGVLPFLDTMHLYAHPSKQEGLPRVVIEALSRGRLAVGSSAAGIPELIDEKFLHSPGDWKKLGNDIQYLLENIDEWKEITDKNLLNANGYLEEELQQKRVNYLKKAINVRT